MMVLLWNGSKLKLYNIGSRGQCYKTFYHGNLPPLHGNTVIQCYKAILPWKSQWNDSKLPQYNFITLAKNSLL